MAKAWRKAAGKKGGQNGTGTAKVRGTSEYYRELAMKSAASRAKKREK